MDFNQAVCQKLNESMLPMNDQTNSGRLISFDESGFTGPELLNEEQPYFVYASHGLTIEEADRRIRNADFS
ncbi:MAG: hypothetical protein COB16_17975 [Rhodobacteraceae bacterium]|nr:MAG: hypothetical protein COB16_17975 [Paracoccaceae bacterium]